MGSGLGPESYAIIEQGRIGQILSSKPQDRRSIIEEAAGITKFKTRKRLAEGRLESARQNLARVFDILEEVTRQVNSLKRQASKARRYGELKIDLDARLRTVLASRHKILSAEIEKTAADLEAASAELKQATETVELSEAERKQVQAACYDVEARLTEARKQLAELNVESERTRGKLEAHVRESATIEQRMAQGETEVQSLEGRIEACGTERETLGGTVAGNWKKASASPRRTSRKEPGPRAVAGARPGARADHRAGAHARAPAARRDFQSEEPARPDGRVSRPVSRGKPAA